MTFVWVVIAALGLGATALIVLQCARASPAASVAAPALSGRLGCPECKCLPRRLQAHGAVGGWQEASVGSEASGLRLAAVHVNVGDMVHRGQVLATFAPKTVQAELAYPGAGVGQARAHAAGSLGQR